MSRAILVFSQNVRYESLSNVISYISDCCEILLLTTHKLFDYELEVISQVLNKPINAQTFADYISKDEMLKCDIDAYNYEKLDVIKYDAAIKKLKNQVVLKNLEKKIALDKKFILSDDLGIDLDVWTGSGYQYIPCEYYYDHPAGTMNLASKLKAALKEIPAVYRYVNNHKKFDKLEHVYVGHWNGKKYVFIGKMNRVKHHIGFELTKSEEEAEKLYRGEFETKDKCVYLTSIHESSQVHIPDSDKYTVYQIQDGYIPPVYSYTYKFIPKNHIYYAWDTMGERVFKSQNIPIELMPFRKKLYMPYPKNVEKVRKVVIVASGAGDWTAMKNRSDEDMMVEAFIEVARKFPNILFIYRCHPTWVHPAHQGVNSINRVEEYLSRAGVSNIVLSSNIPQNTLENFALTHSRSSLAEDIRDADIVFGDHSVSMIDAAMEKTVFSSINVMKRQNLFASMTELGFPHCESVDEIVEFISRVESGEYRDSYEHAVDEYNKMIDEED